MSATYRSITPITSPEFATFPQSLTALSFDPVSDILWAGSSIGNVTGYYSNRGIRGVSFPVGGNLAVNQIVAGDNYVRAFGAESEGLGTWTKGGVNKWFFRSSSNIATFSNASHSSHFFALSLANLELIFMNSMTGSIVRQIPTLSIFTHLQFSHTMLLSGASDGYLRVHDPRTGLSRTDGAESSVKAHLGSISGLQTTGNLAFTIGMGERQSRPYPDPLVKVYDLRTMRPLPPLPFSSGPAFIHVLPKKSSSIAIASSQGLINVVDASNPSIPSEFYQLDLASYLTSFSISPTVAYMACGDAEGVIHLLSQAESNSVPFNGFDGQPVSWGDTPTQLPSIDWSESTPLNSIGLPFYDTQLLSAWSAPIFSPSLYYPPPAKILPQVLNTMKMNENVAYAPLPRELKGRRNVVITGPRKDKARFRSGKPQKEPEPDSATLDHTDVPRFYRRVEIEYSKFGVEDFDFGFYNPTDFSGLETHILNSYTNSLVQVLHYIHPIRRLAKSHITTDCPSEHCLLCELGFVSRMLEDARGTNCQSSNFCKAVGVLAQGSNAIELIDYGRESPEVDYAHKIQIFHRFLIDHLTSEGNTFPHNPNLLRSPSSNTEILSLAAAPITQLVGIDGKNEILCLSCKALREKENMTHVVDMAYPRKNGPNEPIPSFDFATILRNSLLRSMSHKATCQTCKQFANFSSRRSIPSRDLPPFLAINASVYNEENLGFWLDSSKGQTFLQPQVQLYGQSGGIDDPLSVWYEVRSLVVKITTKEKQSHLVAIVKVSEAEREEGYDSPWFVFNDFLVRNVSEDEALSFPDKWKVPAIIYLGRVDLRHTLDFNGLPREIDWTLLCRDTSIAQNRDEKAIKHELLRPEELPQPGTLVAIDAEFVSMQQEETEFRSDGTNKVLRPARLSLARVSVLRGDGLRQGIPFIDDHIHTSEVIVDYLTEFSGIRFGDLDPLLSRHTLTPLKLVYKKLRALVDRGCIFIGHGLSKDFRIINIYVPPEQVIDTVDLYFLKARQRRLSLRFLSWFVLHEHIQTDTHDSIEDARSALNLFHAYQALESEGLFDQKLEELYKEGRQYNYKPPPLPNVSASESASTSHIDSRITQIHPDSKPSTPQNFGTGVHPLSRSWRR